MAFKYLIPEPITPKSDDQYLEELAKNIFRVGFNWQLVEKRWPDIREAFAKFSIEKVARFDDEDIGVLVSNTKIIKHRKKITAIIRNSKLIKAIANEHGSFENYLKSFRREQYPVRRDRIALTFHHLGKTGAFCFLYCVGEDVPSWEERFME